jgi:hypothetical protein
MIADSKREADILSNGHTDIDEATMPPPKQKARYICEIDGTTLSRPSDLERHRLQKHPELYTSTLPYKCPAPGCSRQFPRKDKWLEHTRKCRSKQHSRLTLTACRDDLQSTQRFHDKAVHTATSHLQQPQSLVAVYGGTGEDGPAPVEHYTAPDEDMMSRVMPLNPRIRRLKQVAQRTDMNHQNTGQHQVNPGIVTGSPYLSEMFRGFGSLPNYSAPLERYLSDSSAPPSHRMLAHESNPGPVLNSFAHKNNWLPGETMPYAWKSGRQTHSPHGNDTGWRDNPRRTANIERSLTNSVQGAPSSSTGAAGQSSSERLGGQPGPFRGPNRRVTKKRKGPTPEEGEDDSPLADGSSTGRAKPRLGGTASSEPQDDLKRDPNAISTQTHVSQSQLQTQQRSFRPPSATGVTSNLTESSYSHRTMDQAGANNNLSVDVSSPAHTLGVSFPSVPEIATQPQPRPMSSMIAATTSASTIADRQQSNIPIVHIIQPNGDPRSILDYNIPTVFRDYYSGQLVYITVNLFSQNKRSSQPPSPFNSNIFAATSMPCSIPDTTTQSTFEDTHTLPELGNATTIPSGPSVQTTQSLHMQRQVPNHGTGGSLKLEKNTASNELEVAYVGHGPMIGDEPII